ncbi:DcrB-related protein [Pantoea sp. MBD-2R]|uniref:DcrB-related protein n=1 Tax=Pantoea sp. MBD-2R TaxID=3141540 RepID=UPI0031839FC1
MSNDKKTYLIYEGSFLTPDPAYDQSINILRFRDPDEKEYSILVNRAFMTAGQTLEEFGKAQMNFLENTLPGYHNEGEMLKNTLGPAKLPVIQIANRFYQDGHLVKQVQSFVALPYHPVINPARVNLIIFTLAVQDEFNEFQRKHYVQVINSFNPETLPADEKM